MQPSPNRLRPWYLVVAMSLTAVVGLFGSSNGCATVDFLRGERAAPSTTDVGPGGEVPAWVRSGVVRERARLEALAAHHDRAFPLALAKLVLGMLLLGASGAALAGRRGARNLMLQAVAANAALALVDWMLTGAVREAMASAVAADALEHGVGVPELGMERSVELVRALVVWSERIRLGLLEAVVFGGAALALTRERTREFFAAMARAADQGPSDEDVTPP
jgi:hypothetical protein